MFKFMEDSKEEEKDVIVKHGIDSDADVHDALQTNEKREWKQFTDLSVDIIAKFAEYLTLTEIADFALICKQCLQSLPNLKSLNLGDIHPAGSTSEIETSIVYAISFCKRVISFLSTKSNIEQLSFHFRLFHSSDLIRLLLCQLLFRVPECAHIQNIGDLIPNYKSLKRFIKKKRRNENEVYHRYMPCYDDSGQHSNTFNQLQQQPNQRAERFDIDFLKNLKYKKGGDLYLLYNKLSIKLHEKNRFSKIKRLILSGGEISLLFLLALEIYIPVLRYLDVCQCRVASLIPILRQQTRTQTQAQSQRNENQKQNQNPSRNCFILKFSFLETLKINSQFLLIQIYFVSESLKQLVLSDAKSNLVRNDCPGNAWGVKHPIEWIYLSLKKQLLNSFEFIPKLAILSVKNTHIRRTLTSLTLHRQCLCCTFDNLLSFIKCNLPNVAQLTLQYIVFKKNDKDFSNDQQIRRKKQRIASERNRNNQFRSRMGRQIRVTDVDLDACAVMRRSMSSAQSEFDSDFKDNHNHNHNHNHNYNYASHNRSEIGMFYCANERHPRSGNVNDTNTNANEFNNGSLTSLEIKATRMDGKKLHSIASHFGKSIRTLRFDSCRLPLTYIELKALSTMPRLKSIEFCDLLTNVRIGTFRSHQFKAYISHGQKTHGGYRPWYKFRTMNDYATFVSNLQSMLETTVFASSDNAGANRTPSQSLREDKTKNVNENANEITNVAGIGLLDCGHGDDDDDDDDDNHNVNRLIPTPNLIFTQSKPHIDGNNTSTDGKHYKFGVSGLFDTRQQSVSVDTSFRSVGGKHDQYLTPIQIARQTKWALLLRTIAKERRRQQEEEQLIDSLLLRTSETNVIGADNDADEKQVDNSSSFTEEEMANSNNINHMNRNERQGLVLSNATIIANMNKNIELCESKSNENQEMKRQCQYGVFNAAMIAFYRTWNADPYANIHGVFEFEKCEYCDIIFGFKGTISNIHKERHELLMCPAVRVHCSLCNQLILRREMTNHWERECLGYTLDCKYCHDTLVGVANLQTHYEKHNRDSDYSLRYSMETENNHGNARNLVKAVYPLCSLWVCQRCTHRNLVLKSNSTQKKDITTINRTRRFHQRPHTIQTCEVCQLGRFVRLSINKQVW